MTRNLVIAAVVAVLLGGAVLAVVALAPGRAQPGMPGMAQPGGMADMAAEGPHVPPVRGFAEGREILFIHTEASAPQVAEMLTGMMGSPVLVVPSLAEAPPSALAPVYVFTNGVPGGGPFGFQPDVFPSPPGTSGYTPLRAVHLVAWGDPAAARVLRSAAEVEAAHAQGLVTVERPGAVVNMPFLTWPGGQR